MLVKTNDTTSATIVAPDGSVATKKAAIQFTAEDAALLRQYKKFLAHYGLQEALFCATCGHSSREDGCKAFVQDGQILIECRCSARLYLGQTF